MTSPRAWSRTGWPSTTGTTASSSTASPAIERQAEFFLESYDIDGVIYLDLPDSEVRRRVLARRLCDGCGMDYNLIDSSPREEGKCDVCGGKLVQREDDTEEALAVRLREYHGKTNPVLDIFRRKEYVVTIDARPDKEEVQRAIRDGAESAPVPGLARMRVVAAPDSFKGSIGAAQPRPRRSPPAGVRSARRRRRRASARRRRRRHHGRAGGGRRGQPLARRVRSAGPATARWLPRWLELAGNGAVIELAAAAGLPQLTELSPLTAHSYGVGELIGLRARRRSARTIDVALGGSACTDGGTGALAALGARFLDAGGRGTAARRRCPPRARCRRPDRAPAAAAGRDQLPDRRPGAPARDQAGPRPCSGRRRARPRPTWSCSRPASRRLAGLLGGDPDAPGAGAAGGCGYGLAAAWGARLLPGAASSPRSPACRRPSRAPIL